MSTNYFNPQTYRTPSVFTPPRIDVNIPAMPTIPGTLNQGVVSNQNAPNYAARDIFARQLGGEIATRYKGLMQSRRDAAKAQTRGYGGINWRDDDPTTTDVDESLTPTYESDKMGQNERDAYNAALSRGAASGTTYSTAGDQLVGAALQRVSDEAAKTISQYAGDINNLAGQQLSESSTALNNYMSLYGADADWALRQTVPPPAAKPDANTAPPDQIVAAGGTVGANNPFLAGRTVYSGTRRPDVNAYRSRFSAARGYRVEVRRSGNKYVVVVTYSPSSPGGSYRTAQNVGVNAGSSWDVTGASTA